MTDDCTPYYCLVGWNRVGHASGSSWLEHKLAIIALDRASVEKKYLVIQLKE